MLGQTIESIQPLVVTILSSAVWSVIALPGAGHVRTYNSVLAREGGVLIHTQVCLQQHRTRIS